MLAVTSCAVARSAVGPWRQDDSQPGSRTAAADARWCRGTCTRVHWKDDADTGASSAEIVEKEIEARLMMIKYRHKWGITADEIREMIQEVRTMRKTGRY
jgi:hypothetical protein